MVLKVQTKLENDAKENVRKIQGDVTYEFYFTGAPKKSALIL